MSEIVIFDSQHGDILVTFYRGSVWLTQKQLALLLETHTDKISLHLKNIYSGLELEENTTSTEFSNIQEEGSHGVSQTLKYYNLDAIISVSYRVNPKLGIEFRQWATKQLNEHLIHTYQQKVLGLAKNIPEVAVMSDKTLDLDEIVNHFAHTFLWLLRYDEDQLNEPESHRGGILPTYHQASESLNHLKKHLIERGEATELFAKPRGDGLDALLGNLDQTIFGEPAYPTIQSKAAHLLYFVVKNHPFTDGNKRSGAFLFIDFLKRNNHLRNEHGELIINDSGLAALTLLVAESDPKQKEPLIRLIMNMLAPEA